MHNTLTIQPCLLDIVLSKGVILVPFVANRAVCRKALFSAIYHGILPQQQQSMVCTTPWIASLWRLAPTAHNEFCKSICKKETPNANASWLLLKQSIHHSAKKKISKTAKAMCANALCCLFYRYVRVCYFKNMPIYIQVYIWHLDICCMVWCITTFLV